MSQSQDQTGLAAALKQHHDAAWAWAMACCGRDRDAAHDVLHDVYVMVLQRRAQFLGRSTFKTWLFGVIRVSARAARRKRMLLGLLLAPIAHHPQLAADTSDPDTIATSQRLRRALSMLSTRQRQVAVLVFEHDLTVEESGTVLGISAGACRQHFARAKTKLRAASSASQAMSDDRLRGLLRQIGAQEGAPESFEDVMGPTRRRWRMRRGRAAIAAACLVAVGYAALQARPDETPELAELVLPPTTDWLLETPSADWLTRASQDNDEEKADAN